MCRKADGFCVWSLQGQNISRFGRSGSIMRTGTIFGYLSDLLDKCLFCQITSCLDCALGKYRCLVMRNGILSMPDNNQIVMAAITAYTPLFTPISLFPCLHSRPTLQSLTRRSQLHSSINVIFETRCLDMKSVFTELCSVVCSFHGRDVAFVASSASMCSWVAGRSYGGEIVGFCGTGDVAHAKACAEAIGEVL